MMQATQALHPVQMSAYDFMINKIANLEIEPAQLALAPCSASAVITDVKTGKVLACVSYPGYDNNKSQQQYGYQTIIQSLLWISRVRSSIRQRSRQRHQVPP